MTLCDFSMSNMEDIQRTGDDIRHPIRIGPAILGQESMPHFELLLYRILDREKAATRQHIMALAYLLDFGHYRF